MAEAKQCPELVVLSIDGVPISLIRRLMDQGDMPNLASLAARGSLRQMRSVLPTVSCVAWASYMTGCNPGKHGLYGFVDRRANGYLPMFPNGSVLAASTIFEVLSGAGRKVFGMNVPGSYPPRPVKGIMIGGFLTPTIEKAAYPGSVGEYLRSIDYRIDSDAQLARRDKRAMLDDLNVTLDKRMEAMFHFLEAEDWDFFHTHIMGSDRINHFLWQKMEEEDSEFAPAFFAYYRRIDAAIGKLLERLGEDTAVLIFSDHGFCGIKQEVQLSNYLVEAGWTQAAEKMQHPLSIDAARSRAYCLIPGRLFLNLAGREPGGIVPIEQYQQVREELAESLLALRDPATDEPVIRKVLMREEVYWPTGQQGSTAPAPEAVAQAGGAYGKAADLIAVPHDGYDLKMGLGSDKLFVRTALEGMHTYEDAFLVARGVDVPAGDLEICQLARPILEKLGVEAPADMDGAGGAITPAWL